MKRNIKFNILGWLAAAALLLTTSCVDSLSEVFGGGEYETVTFTIMPETANGLTTRVDYPAEGEYSHISDGTKADMLIYAVYEWDEKTETATLLTSNAEGKDENVPDDIICGEGQTIKMVGQKFPVDVTLKVKRNKTYKVAFWAQSSECKAYSTYDLMNVQMHYSQGSEELAPNNDELRDAFCKVETIVVNKDLGKERTIYLYRPLAQINVGTTGYDYETVVQDVNSKYDHTRVELITTARYLDVVNDRIVETDNVEDASAVNYGYARIPAYINYDEEDVKSLLTKADDTGKEEFLKVHLTKKNEEKEHGKDYQFKPYVSYEEYAKRSADGEKDIETETFKYLSMSYVLVPSETTTSDDNETTTTYGKTSVSNVRVWIATDKDGKDEVEIVNLANVPVQRNYRTNIVGNIMTEDVNINVVLDPIYAGDYNGLYKDGGTVEWSGPLADGVYYDAENDEIQISNVNGLLWLQKMVNGNLVYRQSRENAKEGQIYDGLDESYQDNAISRPSDENLEARILKATHQDKWPTNSNFHFMDSKCNPAKVKLMADIDLSNIEWLPIGLDCWLYDGSIRSHYDAIENATFYYQSDTDTRNHSTIKGDAVRAFCGIFDGNGHTISNVKNKRFGAEVPAAGYQTDSWGPYDNLQWFATGLFGFVSGYAEIKNLRVSNIDFYGYHTGGGIVGTVNGENVKITDCTVDGGKIILSPMYRGDVHRTARTFARGIYAGGIVGFFYADGQISGCHVRSLEMSAYRIIGGLVGAEGKSLGTKIYTKQPTIEGNTVSDVLLIADKFKPYDNFFSISHNSVYKNGYGWNINQKALSNDFVGGTENETYTKNVKSNVIRTEFSTQATAQSTKRIATIGNVPLNYLPMLSSWFCDDLALEAHFSGKPSAYKRHKVNQFDIVQIQDASAPGEFSKNKSEVSGTFNIFPFQLPTDVNVDFDTNSGRVGMYVESVTLNGQQNNAPYSVLTVEDVTGEDDCAMFITSRDLSPFAKFTNQSTTVENMLVRGNPWAYTGICLSPNAYTKSITLDKVSVYDCYQTLALDNGGNSEGTVWPAKKDIYAANVLLSVSYSNLRGYTVPGAGWKSVTYSNVVFEKGASTGNGLNERTCEVDVTTDGTTFTYCTFKAPFIIKIKNNAEVKFDHCKATFGVNKETEIDQSLLSNKTEIIVDATGNVTYQ